MYNHYRFYVNVSICHSPTRNKTTLIHFHSIKVQTYTVWESGWVSLPFSNSLWHAHTYFFPFFYTYTKQYTHTKTNIIHIHHSFHVIFFSSIEIKRDTVSFWNLPHLSFYSCDDLGRLVEVSGTSQSDVVCGQFKACKSLYHYWKNSYFIGNVTMFNVCVKMSWKKSFLPDLDNW